LATAIKAFNKALKISESAIVERHIYGHDFRLLTVNHKLVGAAKRTPAHVTGDGQATIKQLVDAVNNDPRRGEGHENELTKIHLGPSAKSIIKNKGYTLTTILSDGEILYLDHAANLSKGGTATDVLDTLHPRVISTAQRISKIAGLDICGIDVMASTLEQPLAKTGGVILEVNAAPGFRMHLAPSKGKARNVAAPVIEMLFPKGSKSRIPITAVTGTNGKTTTTRLIAHIMQKGGQKVGYTTTDGVYIDDERLMKGDCGGPKSAALVLRDPAVETAVLECARGGLLREGLGFDRCDVAVVTNISSDHLGLKGINTLDKMARLKAVVPESVHPDGYAVLNADDERVYAMRNKLRCKVALFSMKPDTPQLLNHRHNGGICAVYEDNKVMIWDGNTSHTLGMNDNLPLSFGGRAGFMIENILAAAAASYIQNISLDVIRKGLKSFNPSPEHTPGRMNLFSFPGYDVMIDYAHNAAGMKGIQHFLDASSYQQTTGIVTAMGDRRLEDHLEIGRISAEIFDHIIIREDADLRGKAPGEVTEMIKQGIANANHMPKVTAIADEKEALLYAMKNALPGSLILHCTEKVDDVLNYMNSLRSKFNSRKPIPQKKNIDLSIMPPA
jgi:cyanophycin synthetase